MNKSDVVAAVELALVNELIIVHLRHDREATSNRTGSSPSLIASNIIRQNKPKIDILSYLKQTALDAETRWSNSSFLHVTKHTQSTPSDVGKESCFLLNTEGQTLQEVAAMELSLLNQSKSSLTPAQCQWESNNYSIMSIASAEIDCLRLDIANSMFSNSLNSSANSNNNDTFMVSKRAKYSYWDESRASTTPNSHPPPSSSLTKHRHHHKNPPLQITNSPTPNEIIYSTTTNKIVRADKHTILVSSEMDRLLKSLITRRRICNNRVKGHTCLKTRKVKENPDNSINGFQSFCFDATTSQTKLMQHLDSAQEYNISTEVELQNSSSVFDTKQLIGNSDKSMNTSALESIRDNIRQLTKELKLAQHLALENRQALVERDIISSPSHVQEISSQFTKSHIMTSDESPFHQIKSQDCSVVGQKSQVSDVDFCRMSIPRSERSINLIEPLSSTPSLFSPALSQRNHSESQNQFRNRTCFSQDQIIDSRSSPENSSQISSSRNSHNSSNLSSPNLLSYPSNSSPQWHGPRGNVQWSTPPPVPPLNEHSPLSSTSSSNPCLNLRQSLQDFITRSKTSPINTINNMLISEGGGIDGLNVLAALLKEAVHLVDRTLQEASIKCSSSTASDFTVASSRSAHSTPNASNLQWTLEPFQFDCKNTTYQHNACISGSDTLSIGDSFSLSSTHETTCGTKDAQLLHSLIEPSLVMASQDFSRQQLGENACETSYQDLFLDTGFEHDSSVTNGCFFMSPLNQCDTNIKEHSKTPERPKRRSHRPIRTPCRFAETLESLSNRRQSRAPASKRSAKQSANVNICSHKVEEDIDVLDTQEAPQLSEAVYEVN